MFRVLISLVFVVLSGCAQAELSTAFDVSGPAAITTNPVDDATDVATNLGNFSVQVDEEADAAASSCSLTCGGTTIQTGSPTFNSENMNLVCPIQETLPASSNCEGTMNATDQSGNTNTTVISFGTGTQSDTDPPGLADNPGSPANNGTGVSTQLGGVEFCFDEAMDSTRCAVSNCSGTNNINFSSASMSGNCCTCNIQGNLSANTNYTVTLSNQQDRAGNSAGNVTRTFTTGAGADTTAPTVAAITPANGDMGSSICQPIYVCLSETVSDAQCTVAKATYTPAAVPAGDGAFTYCQVTGPPPARSTKSVSCSGTEFEFGLGWPDVVNCQPAMGAQNQTWNNNTTYTITIQNISDSSGNTMSPFTITFRTQP